MKCECCTKNFPEKKIDLHHTFPKYLGGTDKDPRMYLCQKCHKQIHEILKISQAKTEEECFNITNSWMKKEIKNPICCNREMFISEVGSNYLIFRCALCGKEVKSQELFINYLKGVFKHGLGV